jgi:hypothetical protein
MSTTATCLDLVHLSSWKYEVFKMWSDFAWQIPLHVIMRQSIITSACPNGMHPSCSLPFLRLSKHLYSAATTATKAIPSPALSLLVPLSPVAEATGESEVADAADSATALVPLSTASVALAGPSQCVMGRQQVYKSTVEMSLSVISVGLTASIVSCDLRHRVMHLPANRLGGGRLEGPGTGRVVFFVVIMIMVVVCCGCGWRRDGLVGRGQDALSVRCRAFAVPSGCVSVLPFLGRCYLPVVAMCFTATVREAERAFLTSAYQP